MTENYTPLPHRYRPRTWSDLVGQAVATRTLRKALQLGRVFPAYIFAGAAGCGKTTAARIFGMCLNCDKLSSESSPCLKCPSCVEALRNRNPDILEIDGPSHGSVAHIRDLKEKALYQPQNNYRVFIIDEAHGLSRDAFEAFLKLLEEPPAHVVFILATTNPERLPATIRSRSIELSFRRHTEENVVARLLHVARSEKIALHQDAADIIARAADGNIRNSITELDKITTIAPGVAITAELVSKTLGVISGSEIHSIMSAVASRDAIALEETLMNTLSRTTEFGLITRALTDWYRDALRVRAGAGTSVDRGESDMVLLKAFAKKYDTAQLARAIEITWRMSEQTRFGSGNPKTFFLTGLYLLMAIGEDAFAAEPSGPPEATGKVFNAPPEPMVPIAELANKPMADLEAELAKLSER